VTWKKALAGLAVVLLVMALPVSGFANPRTYTITADAPGITGCALNNHGDFAGADSSGWLWVDVSGTLRYLGYHDWGGWASPGDYPYAPSYLKDYGTMGLNDAGQMAKGYGSNPEVSSDADLGPGWGSIIKQDMAPGTRGPPTQNFYGTAAGINNSGQVAGNVITPSEGGTAGAFLSTPWMPGVPPPGYRAYESVGCTQIFASSAYTSTALNDAGDVVGYAKVGEYCRAFIYSNGNLQDMGLQAGPVGNITLASDINNSRVVVGESTMVGLTQFGWGFVWEDGVYRGLGAGTMYGAANSINDSNEIVGACGLTSNFYEKHAYLWTDDIRPYDLNSLVNNLPTGFVLNEAVDINNNGQILCNGSYVSSGLKCSFLLTPTGFFADVPEPSPASLLLGVAIAALVLRLRRKEQAELSTL